jgi:methionyl-tRNA synthetase
MSRKFYVTTAIPYVNAEPHIGFALELVQADVLARHRRLRGDHVRFLSGTDENALKNVQAAEAEGVPVAELVDRNAARFAALRETLALSYDDFIRTSVDPRHRPGVERLWRACGAAGDLYERDYDGFYCTGCEAFLAEGERCGEHAAPPEPVSERNWFFRLSRYQDELLELIESGRLRIEPDTRRNEVLAFLRAGLTDISVSRSRSRARGWGIPVPDDPSQVVYVWFDALANYVTALAGGLHRQWWSEDHERLHVVGKGILRFHAVYWPAILLAAGERLPTTIAVHDYVTVNSDKVGKSRGNARDPDALVGRYGVDALRWWLLRESPRGSDADFREELLVSRANDELANGLGNLVSRTIALVRRYRPDGVDARPTPPLGGPLPDAVARLAATIDAALAEFDFRAAAGAIVDVVDEANRFVSTTRPWELVNADRDDELDTVLSLLLHACGRLADELQPFLPSGAERIATALRELDPAVGRSLFPRLRVAEGGCP